MKKVIFASAVVFALIGCQQKEPTTETAPASAPAAPATTEAPAAAPAAPAGEADKK